MDPKEHCETDSLVSRSGTSDCFTKYRRNLLGFWILGVTNNFAYIIMLSAAEDILDEQQDATGNPFNNATISITTSTPDVFKCYHLGTGIVLLADILPCLCIKLTGPFFIDWIPYWLRAFFTAVCSAVSFLIVAISTSVYIRIFGVVICSLGIGMGEITLLSMTSYFHRDTISTWSSGTGLSCLVASFSYAGMRQAGIPFSTILYSMTFVPVLMLLSYFLILKEDKMASSQKPRPEEMETLGRDDSTPVLDRPRLTLRERFRLLPPLLSYIIPLIAVYLAEYIINQALFELLFFKDVKVFKEHLGQGDQYRWFQVHYQIGVFISRSSVNLFQIHKLWIMPILQCCVLVVLLVETLHPYIPSIWIVFAIVLFEGLLGGATYVNVFYKLADDVSEDNLEFSMAAASMPEAIGITAAGLIAIPVHNAICNFRMSGNGLLSFGY